MVEPLILENDTTSKKTHLGRIVFEVAQSCLKNENMHDEADSISPLINNMQSVQNQLNIGLELSQEKRDFEGFDKEPKPERLLTSEVMQTFQRLEDALQQPR